MSANAEGHTEVRTCLYKHTNKTFRLVTFLIRKFPTYIHKLTKNLLLNLWILFIYSSITTALQGFCVEKTISYLHYLEEF